VFGNWLIIIPQIIATLLQNYLLNNFASSIASVILPNAAIAGLQEHGGAAPYLLILESVWEFEWK
jgi:hypothetical protein